MLKALQTATSRALEAKSWHKFTVPTVDRGKTVFPRTDGEQESLGVRWDYAGEITKDGTVFNKFKMQPNAGKIPPPIKKWREDNGGTDAVMVDVFVKKDGTKEDVEEGLDASIEKFMEE